MTTDTTSETGRLTIEGLLADGDYRTKESYTQAQIDEILDIAEQAGKAVLRCVRPDLENMIVVDKIQDRG